MYMVQKTLIIIFFIFLSFIKPVQADTGLSYKTYACPSWPCSNSGTVLSTGVVSNLNFNWGGGQILNSGRSDYVSVVFKGKIIWPGSTGLQKNITFYTANDDGVLLKINEQTVLNDWSGIHPARSYNSSGSITLTSGKIYSFEFWFSEWGGGAVAQLYWNIGNGIEIVPSSAFFYNQPISGGGSSYFSEITDTQIQIYNTHIERQSQLTTGNKIYIDQKSGSSNNNIRIEQYSNNNSVQGLDGTQYFTISGQNNDIIIRQGNPSNLIGKNLLELNLSGSFNILEINQSRIQGTGLAESSDNNNHISRLNIIGFNNVLRTQQTNTLQGGHFMSVDVIGNGNGLLLKQTGDNTKKLFSSVNGDNNTLTTLQTDQGSHYLDITLNGSNNSANIIQKNNGSHKASINLTNAGGSNNLNLVQQGNLNQVYSIIQNCVNIAGCTTNVTQGQ